MKKLSFLIILFLASVVAVQAQHPAPKNVVKPDPQALAQIKAGKAYLVDVRTPEEFDGGHLQYSQNINFNGPDFKTQIAKLDKNKPVYLYCRSGNRSGKAADTLKTLGFHSYYNIGGFEQLKADGFPAEQLQTSASRK
ncbi:rhodanese-related sulfurtransferase [Dyadobacter sp. BE34]|uniref:Rhodanese-related sulfurtransferase n=1 Tax=Dyadobacter fermentans TaxID=94254 RepID=A0ABU1QZV6_9BACT|nr:MULTISPECIES: rhodanese-like domain-containing protein [Dyadobacter]MDR6806688.1 rhodanese-related sulfurtransferase [Dyadobacter fermentans]MDR7044430.1 rhodanese-related sulfurtransferase [Dyadobacter sp. BE242]MDR7198740.1 rhodanese-related sulfurtransferase [Dyadobacter sp. BE34]MDR7216702.1 rhodanese-related sulfurtransferase [Dyadobacter sp. BE31]MDR7263772.1 rhodanese-related sulfurtransferase [Dyadobacter sp. BE32]